MNHGLDDHHTQAEASSSSSQPSPQDPAAAHALPHADHDDTRRPGTDDHDLLGDDPLSKGNLGSPISFKRKPKKRGFLDLAQGSRLLASLTGSASDSDRGSGAGSAHGRGARQQQQEHGSSHLGSPQNSPRSPRRRGGGANNNSSAAKDGAPLDWYVEGPGRRVGYEDLTAIDWIFEYTKERTRLRVLRSSTQGLIGKLQLSFDSAQEWIILVSTGVLVGTLAAVIDITTDWLADLKAGYCSNADGGRFYLNRAFCCLGYEDASQCSGWRSWASVLHVTSAAGSYIVEWIFFLMFSVGLPSPNSSSEHHSLTRIRSFLLCVPVFWSRSLRYMQSTAVYPRSRLYWEGSLSRSFWEYGHW